MLRHQFVHAVGELRQEAFGFRHGQRACGQRDAGHGVLALRRHAITHQPMVAGKAFDLLLVLGAHVGHDQVLVGRKPEIALVNLGNLAHAGLQRFARAVHQTAVLDEQRQVPVAFLALHPADAVAPSGEFIGADGLELRAHAVFHFGDEHVGANALQRVAGLGILAVAAVAPVTLHRHDGSSAVEHLVQRQEAEFARHVGIGAGVAMLHRQAAAHQHVEADEMLAVTDGHEVQVVGVQVHVVVRRDDHRGLELARQIALAQHGFGVVAASGLVDDRGAEEVFGGLNLLPVQPDLRVGPGTGQQMLGDLLGPFPGFTVQ